MLDVEHGLELGIGEFLGPRTSPVAELYRHAECLPVTAVKVHVEQAGQKLVDLVPEGQGRFAAAGELVRVGAEKTVAPFFLALGQAGHHPVGFAPELSIPRAGKHKSAGRQIMAHELAAGIVIGGHPTAVRLSGRGEPGTESENVKEPIRIE